MDIYKEAIKNMNIQNETCCEAYCSTCCRNCCTSCCSSLCDTTCECSRDCGCDCVRTCAGGIPCEGLRIVQPPKSVLITTFKYSLKVSGSGRVMKKCFFVITTFVLLSLNLSLGIERAINYAVDEPDSDSNMENDDVFVHIKFILSSIQWTSFLYHIAMVLYRICKKFCCKSSAGYDSCCGCSKCCRNCLSWLYTSYEFVILLVDIVGFANVIVSSFEMCILFYDRQSKENTYDTSETALAIIDFICSILAQITLYIGHYIAAFCLFWPYHSGIKGSNEDAKKHSTTTTTCFIFTYVFAMTFIQSVLIASVSGRFYYDYSDAKQQNLTTAPALTLVYRRVDWLNDLGVLIWIMVVIGGLIRIASYVVACTTYYWWLSKESVLFYRQSIESLPKAEIDNILKEMKVNATSVATHDEGNIEMKVDIESEQQKFNKVIDSLDYYIDENDDANCCLKFIQPFVSPLNIILCIIYVVMAFVFTTCLVLAGLDDINDPNKSWPLYIGAFGVLLLVLCNIYQFIVGIFWILVVTAVVIIVLLTVYIVFISVIIVSFVCILFCIFSDNKGR